MGFEKKIPSADVLHPKATPRWITGAIIAVALFAVVMTVGFWLFTQGKNLVQPVVSKIVPSSTTPTQSGISNGTGAGAWFY